MRYFGEFHDTYISLVKDGEGEVVFRVDHMPVFHETPPDRSEVWSYVGSLHFRGEVAGKSGATSGRISEVIGIRNVVELASSEQVLERTFATGQVQILFDDGSSLAVNGNEAVLTLTEKGEKLEDWDGPLLGEDEEGVLLLPVTPLA